MHIKWEKHGLPTRNMFKSIICEFDDNDFKTEIVAHCQGIKKSDSDKFWAGYLMIDGWRSEMLYGDNRDDLSKQMLKYINNWRKHMKTFITNLKRMLIKPINDISKDSRAKRSARLQ